MTHYCYHYYHHNHYHHYVTTTTTTTTITSIATSTFQTLRQMDVTLLGVVASFCTYLKFLTAFKFFATNPKKNTQQHAKMVFKRTQHVTHNSAGSCWPTLLLQLLLPPPQLPIPLFLLLLTFELIDLMESQKSDNNSSNNNCLAKWKLTVLINPF